MMKLKRLLLAFVCLLVSMSVLINYYWLRDSNIYRYYIAYAGKLSVLLLSIMLLTLCNLFLRWTRWHYLIRILNARLNVRESMKIFMVTLPAILTPFYIGELSRSVLLSRRYPHLKYVPVWIWMIERFLDVAVVGIFVVASLGHYRIALALLALIITIFAAMRNKLNIAPDKMPRQGGSGIKFALNIAMLTSIAWSLPVAGMFSAIYSLTGFPDLQLAAYTFSKATIIGGLSGIPQGMGITGSIEILTLLQGGLPQEAASNIVLLFRLGTTWFAVLLGIGSLILFSPYIKDIFRARDSVNHFDDISSEYISQVPEHVRLKLVLKKTGLLEEKMRDIGIDRGAIGLDLGCGQGWYACEMSRLGYSVTGVDYSIGQIQRARSWALENGAMCTFMQMDARALKFQDNMFDFAYSINSLHHITDPNDQKQVLREVVRVLKPGGAFFLHEMNTINPMFRFYLNYLFPLVKNIDEGTESWISPKKLPDIEGARWTGIVNYFTFTPDFMPKFAVNLIHSIEDRLERSSLSHYGAHYLATLIKVK